MNQFICDQCGRPIPATPAAMHVSRVFDGPLEHGDAVDADVCDAVCLRHWLASNYPEKRPDFEGTRADLNAKLSSLPVPDTRAQRLTADELADYEATHAADALDDAVDAGLLDDDEPEFEGEPVAFINSPAAAS